jgi:hypothetical protein
VLTAAAAAGAQNLVATPGWSDLSDGAVYSGTGTPSLGILGAAAGLNGNIYQCLVANQYGFAVSNPVSLTVAAGPPAPVAPTITDLPVSQTVAVGTALTLYAAAAGTAPYYFQWLKNGVAFGTPAWSDAPASSYTFQAAQVSDSGVYAIRVTTSAGSATSPGATVTVQAPGAPEISAQPQSQSVAAGAAAVLSVSASGAGLSYQWQVDGTSIAGATQPTLNLGAIGTTQAGSYTVVVTNGNGSVTSSPAIVTVATDARPVNLSSRAGVAGTSQPLVAGFVISGATAETLLVRAVGPTLAQFGVIGALANPQLTVYDSAGKAVASNSGWGAQPVGGVSAVSAGIQPATAAVFSQVYAFALPAGSADSAMVLTLPPGSYTAQVTGLPGASGIALVEVYEVP